MTRRREGQRSGFSLVEVCFSTVITGVLLVSALEVFRSSVLTGVQTARRGRADALANDLLSEILSQPYVDTDGTGPLGYDSGESSVNRGDFDDVDDYHNWDESPPQYKNGTTLTYLEGWRRQVSVRYASATDPNVNVGSDQGLKRVTVTISHQGAVLATAVGVRANI
jgi:type II secretory pathway pseudopilin PulG